MDWQYEMNLKEDIANEDDVDIWGDIQVYTLDKGKNLGIGAEYNYCIDDGEDNSAIYMMYEDKETGDWDTDTDDYIHYEIDFTDPEWDWKILQAMKDFVSRKYRKKNGKINEKKKYLVIKRVIQEWTVEIEAKNKSEALEEAYGISEDEWTPPAPDKFIENYTAKLIREK